MENARNQTPTTEGITKKAAEIKKVSDAPLALTTA